MALHDEKLHDYECRPSPLGVFLTRIGFKKDGRKSPVAATTLHNNERVGSTDTPYSSYQQQSKDNRVSPDRAVSLVLHQTAESRKAKRRSSPFLRLVHRISMNRKTNRKDGSDSNEMIATETPIVVTSSNEEIGASSSSVGSTTPETFPRPAWSENDLRHITIRKDKVPIEDITPLKGVSTFSLEDNLLLNSPDTSLNKKHTPSYLRVSCALSGYRGRGYRSCDKNPVLSPSPLPLGLVERRTLTFESTQTTASTPSTAFNTERMMGTMLNTPTPVRQLVAQFDSLHINDGNKNRDEDSTHDKSLDSGTGGGQLSPICGSQLIEECSALPASTTLESSIPFSGQTLDKALSQPTPEPELAHAIHSGLRESTVSQCQPNAKNFAEVIVSELQVSGPDLARTVISENSYSLLSGEHFRKLLVICRETLEKRTKAAAEILDNETDIPEPSGDAIRLAVGKANLLLSKKMKKFAELIEKNLNPIDGDSQPAKVDDLSAYWDLVKMELSDVERLFSDVDLLRQNNWQPISDPDGTTYSTEAQLKLDEKSVRKGRLGPASRQKDTGKTAAAEKQRRQALAEAKRKLRERMQQEDVELASFVI